MKYVDAWVLWAVMAAGFAALTAIFAKIGVEDVNSDFATFLRTIIVLLISSGIVVATGHSRPLSEISARTWMFLSLSGMATGLSWICYFRALKLGQASQVAPVDKLSAAFVAVIAAIFLGESLSSTGWLGIGFVSVGAVLLALG